MDPVTSIGGYSENYYREKDLDAAQYYGPFRDYDYVGSHIYQRTEAAKNLGAKGRN